jgi:putative copper export protein
MADLLAASFKTIMLACASLLVGFVVLRSYLMPETPLNRQQRWWLGLLTATLLLVSIIDMLWRIRSVLGFVTPELALNYLQNTRHGVAVLWRSGLVLLLMVTLLQTRVSGWLVTLVSSLSAAGVLYTFSTISHAAAMGGVPETLLDWTHFAAASSWAGGLLALVLSPALLRTPERLLASVSRLSKLGLAAVIVLLFSGMASARLHVDSAAVLTTTSYGQALLVKNALVLVTLALAAANRWVFLPAVRRLQPALAEGAGSVDTGYLETGYLETGGARALLTALRYEAVLLAAVLAATGWLTTQPMPHN